MTTLVVDGNRYRVENAFSDVSLAQVIRCKRETGFGLQAISNGMDRLGSMKPEDLLEDPDMLSLFGALVWLCRTAAGEDITFEESNRLKVSELGLLEDEGDAEEPPDPQPATPPSAAVAKPRPAASKARTSRTSKRK